MKRTSRRLFFHEMVDFPKKKRYFGVVSERSVMRGLWEKNKTIPNVLTRILDLHAFAPLQSREIAKNGHRDL